ncbi:GNAT family N-acetyltransferase [Pantoea phytobeneficialis]|uniref:GNAT family N-acetyltransferase n=2 Tax=Pantoea phytobeneficialis TaxID=2052056 RepID=A0ABT8XVX0_9GAMM|nr:GNAT family N-acetyltransferase [Pantoea phytobeneficialis]MDO6407030.1 GNAT family N-acetyltransferase [Pantoea phytobeneficialis]
MERWTEITYNSPHCYLASRKKMRLLSTARTDIYLLTENFAEAYLAFLLNNRDHFSRFEPLRTEEYFTLEHTRQRIADSATDFAARKNLLLVFTPKDEDKIIGSINFTNFVYGVFQACYLGFSLDHAYQGKGLMHEALEIALAYVQREYGLHRVMANHLPGNLRSSNTLTKLGFSQEGFAKSYLKINGSWQDHVLNALIFDESI